MSPNLQNKLGTLSELHTNRSKNIFKNLSIILSQYVQKNANNINPKCIMRGDIKLKQKNEEKKNSIFRALQDGYSVKRNDNDTYTFTRDRSRNESLSKFVRRCSSLTMSQF